MGTSEDVVRRNQAVSLLREGKAQECIESLHDLLRDNPNDHQAYTCLGAACSQQMQWDNAISAFARALSLNPCCKSHYNLGLAYERCGRLQDASIHFQSATALDPSYGPAVESLARVKAAMTAEPPPPERDDPVEAIHEDPQQSSSETPAAETPQIDPGTSPVWAEAQGLDFSAAEAKMSRQAGGEALEKVLTREQMDIERATKDAETRKRMTRSGLIYGAGIGAFVYTSLLFCMQMVGFSALLFKFSLFAVIGILALIGAAIGASVGLAVGYTSGGESTGMKVGMIAGVFTEVTKCFIAGNANVLSLFGAVIIGAILGIIVGQLVARLVDLSIGWD